MKFMKRLFGGGSAPAGAPALSGAPPQNVVFDEPFWIELGGLKPSQAGGLVTWEKALMVSTALRCCTILAEAISTVPFKLYQRVEQGQGRARRIEAREKRLYDLLTTAPNDFQTSLEFFETMGLHYALTGNAFAFKNTVRGEVVELLPIQPNRVTIEQKDDWSLEYTVTGLDGATAVFPADAIWHIRGRSWNAVTGLEAVKLAREAMGLALATEESHSRMHNKGVRPGGVLSVEGKLTEDQFKFYKKWIDSHGSAANAGRTLVLDSAAKWQAQQVMGVDAQHLETRNHQIEEICRFFGVLPIMVGYSDKTATYASAEQMFLAHSVHTVRPLHRRIEKSADLNLLRRVDRQQGFYTGFVDAEMLRGAAKDRAEYYERMVRNGIMTRNEARGFEDMDSIDGLDRPLLPINTTVVDENGMPIAPLQAQPNSNSGADLAQNL
jgi:HK97 family phage portal protein